jgi:hypothetical protein
MYAVPGTPPRISVPATYEQTLSILPGVTYDMLRSVSIVVNFQTYIVAQTDDPRAGADVFTGEYVATWQFNGSGTLPAGVWTPGAGAGVTMNPPGWTQVYGQPPEYLSGATGNQALDSSIFS